MKRTLVAVLAVLALDGARVLAQEPATDPVDGTWRINVARSTYNPGPAPPPMTSQIRKFATLGDGWHLFELTSVTPEGDALFQSVAFKLDGKQYPVYTNVSLVPLMTRGTPSNITRSWRRINAWSTEFTTYTNGVPGLAIVRTVSKDGKTYTETSKGRDTQGREVNNVVAFDRVR